MPISGYSTEYVLTYLNKIATNKSLHKLYFGSQTLIRIKKISQCVA